MDRRTSHFVRWYRTYHKMTKEMVFDLIYYQSRLWVNVKISTWDCIC